MKEDVESIVGDIRLYSKGLILAIQKDNPDDAMNYVSKMTHHLKTVRAYIKMKKAIKK